MEAEEGDWTEEARYVLYYQLKKRFISVVVAGFFVLRSCCHFVREFSDNYLFNIKVLCISLVLFLFSLFYKEPSFNFFK
jgi:hypothetical protein